MFILTRKCKNCGERKEVVKFLGVPGPIGFCNSCRIEKQNQPKPHRVIDADEKDLTYSRRRRLRESKAGGKRLHWREWNKILDKYGNRCLCCGTTKRTLVQDHILPIAKGGKTTVDNIQPLCADCNNWKKDKYIDFRLVSVVFGK